MRLQILNVAYPLARVGADAVGGAEQVLAQVERTAVAKGHRSIVIAPDGSDVAGELVSIPRQDGNLDIAAAERSVRAAIDRVLAAEDIDVMHFHGVDFDKILPSNGPPALVTLHLPPDWYPSDIWTKPDAHLHCVSESQSRRCPQSAELWPVIPNGVDLDAFRPRSRKRPFALMLGRICPEKGFHIALEAACRATGP